MMPSGQGALRSATLFKGSRFRVNKRYAPPQDAGFHILIQYIKVFKRRQAWGFALQASTPQDGPTSKAKEFYLNS